MMPREVVHPAVFLQRPSRLVPLSWLSGVVLHCSRLKSRLSDYPTGVPSLVPIRGGVPVKSMIALPIGTAPSLGLIVSTRHSEVFFFYLVCETIGTAATPGLLCQPRVILKMIVESRWNVDWQGKPKFSEKTCPSATFVHHKIPHA
jgi:hypothetical protein